MHTKNGADAEQIDVAHVAHLARLHLNDEEIRTFQEQLSRIVEYVKKISKLDLTGIEPTAHAITVHNVFRSDEVLPSLDRDSVLANAPATNKEQFLVPKIIE